MSASANTYNIQVSDQEVRLTFIANRPKLTSTNSFSPPMHGEQVSEVVGEVVICRQLFDMLLDQGQRLVTEHELNRAKSEGRADN